MPQEIFDALFHFHARGRVDSLRRSVEQIVVEPSFAIDGFERRRGRLEVDEARESLRGARRRRARSAPTRARLARPARSQARRTSLHTRTCCVLGLNFRRVRRCEKLTLLPKPTVRPWKSPRWDRLGSVVIARMEPAVTGHARTASLQGVHILCGPSRATPLFDLDAAGVAPSSPWRAELCAFDTLSDQ